MKYTLGKLIFILICTASSAHAESPKALGQKQTAKRAASAKKGLDHPVAERLVKGVYGKKSHGFVSEPHEICSGPCHGDSGNVLVGNSYSAPNSGFFGIDDTIGSIISFVLGPMTFSPASGSTDISIANDACSGADILGVGNGCVFSF